MKKFAIILALSLLLPVGGHAASGAISAEKKALIDTLLEQSGQSAIAMGKQFSDLFMVQMTDMLKKAKPDIDPRAFVILGEEVTAVINEKIVADGVLNNMMYPIYSRHFNEAELREMIAFNDTVLGRKIIRVLPEISQESLRAGQQMGAGMGPEIERRILERFRKEGIK